MKIIDLVLSIALSLLLASCAATRLEPSIIAAKTTYFAQSVTVKPALGFTAGLSSIRGETPEALGLEFSNALEASLRKDLPDLMKGQSPAIVSVELSSISKGPGLYSSPVTTINSVLTITDAATGATVSQLTVQSNDREMKNQMNSDPVAGLAATLILKAVLPAKNLELLHLTNVMRRDIRVRLGGSSLY
jgi:hypothetical protein